MCKGFTLTYGRHWSHSYPLPHVPIKLNTTDIHW